MSGLNMAVENCDTLMGEVLKDSDFKERFTDFSYAGKGATACVWFAKDTENDGAKVAVKVGKEASIDKVLQWKGECGQMNLLRLSACEESQKTQSPESDLLALSEAFHPNCLGVGKAGEYPYMVQHAAPSDPIKGVGKWGEPSEVFTLTTDDQKYMFAQLVGAVYGLHGINISHNDLHGENIVFDSKDSSIPLALIDFGDSTPMVDAIKINYKRDGNALYRWTAHLANCPKEGTINQQVTSIELRQAKPAFLDCMKDNWGADDAFRQAFATIIEADAEESSEQHVKELYVTSFVQDILKARAGDWKKPRYQWKGAENCENWDASEFQRKRDEAIYGDKYKCDTIPTYHDGLCPVVNPVACFSLIKDIPWSCQPTPDIDPKLRCQTVGLPADMAPGKFYDGACIMKEHRGYEFALKFNSTGNDPVTLPPAATTTKAASPGATTITTTAAAAPDQTTTTTTKPKGGGTNVGLIVGIIIGIVVVLGLIAGAVIYNQGQARQVGQAARATELAESFTEA